MKLNRMIVVGTSAGGLEALTRLIAPLAEDFPAPIFVVQHLAADTSGKVLVETLRKHGRLGCEMAVDGERFQAGRIYVAPPDHHMLITKGKIKISKGARENRSRPGIDPLFRSAAVAYGAQVIGVVLTGYLDDGSSGLLAIQRCGGICVVQQPAEAMYPDMPQNALNNLTPDYCLSVNDIGELLTKLVLQPAPKSPPVPADIISEALIAERVVSDVTAVEHLGDQVPFNCPNCNGVLWKMKEGSMLRYRCHTGHAFTAAVLLAEQTKHLEETLWVALRMFEERKNLLRTMAQAPGGLTSRSADERAKESQVHIERIRSILLSSSKSPLPKVTQKPRRSARGLRVKRESA
ncbi:MAG: CheB methylesterase [Verrucomicrobia bacterium]|jgi:two-component system chemotaxis response regulator CheB|nr:CheB methylesterase [Verrucomicrobiota bacterium]